MGRAGHKPKAKEDSGWEMFAACAVFNRQLMKPERQEPPAGILVLGCGNPLRRNEGGPKVAGGVAGKQHNPGLP